jgi:dihydroxyacetone kinase
MSDACGGTLGAIFSIFLAGFTTSLIDSVSADPSLKATPAFFGETALRALEALKQRTAARVGHRTVMDSLIPFAESLASTGDLKQAAAAARKGGEATKDMTAKLGRATYVGDRADRDMPPDPGAMALVAVVEGLAKVLG